MTYRYRLLAETVTVTIDEDGWEETTEGAYGLIDEDGTFLDMAGITGDAARAMLDAHTIETDDIDDIDQYAPWDHIDERPDGTIYYRADINGHELDEPYVRAIWAERIDQQRTWWDARDILASVPFAARDWHNGQTSALYALASTGTYVDGVDWELEQAARSAHELNTDEPEDNSHYELEQAALYVETILELIDTHYDQLLPDWVVIGPDRDTFTVKGY